MRRGMVQDYCKENGLFLVETSAMHDTNVEQAFLHVALDLYKKAEKSTINEKSVKTGNAANPSLEQKSNDPNRVSTKLGTSRTIALSDPEARYRKPGDSWDADKSSCCAS